MEAFEHMPQEKLGLFQLPPHVMLKQVKVDTLVRVQVRVSPVVKQRSHEATNLEAQVRFLAGE